MMIIRAFMIRTARVEGECNIQQVAFFVQGRIKTVKLGVSSGGLVPKGHFYE